MKAIIVLCVTSASFLRNVLYFTPLQRKSCIIWASGLEVEKIALNIENYSLLLVILHRHTNY